MDSTSDLVLALHSLRSHVRATDRLELFVLNAKEFVLRNEGEVFHFVNFLFTEGHLGFEYRQPSRAV